MRHRPFFLTALILSCLPLSGCQEEEDDSTNIPLRGHWEAVVKLVALTIDDRSVTADEVPFPISASRGEDKGCFEPKFKTVDELNAISALEQNKCQVATLDHDGGSITAHGKCQPVGRGSVTITGSFDLSAGETSDRIKGLATSNFSVHLPDGETIRLHSAYTMTWTRLGPCWGGPLSG